MIATKTSSAWAVASVVLVVLGWLTAVPLPLIDYGYIGGATAGVGVIGPCLLGLLSFTLGLLGAVFGVVALARTRGDEVGGRGIAWIGTSLGVLLVTGYVVISGRFLFGLW